MNLKIEVIVNSTSSKRITKSLLLLLSKYEKNILSNPASINNKIDSLNNNSI